MEASDLIRNYPRLYHMAQADAWEGIVAHGLLSTSALLTLFEVPSAERDAIEASRRPEPVPIAHKVHGQAVIRDNKPISEVLLAACLVDTDSATFFRLLNQRVFFWLTSARLDGLLKARAYRRDPHLVITVDTAALVDRYASDVTLSAINSGATVYRAMPRGRGTFVPIADYDYVGRRRLRGVAGAIAELAVTGGVREISGVALMAEVRYPDGQRRPIWSSAIAPWKSARP